MQNVNEAKLQLGRRPDEYLVLTVNTLVRLDKLTIDGTVIQFRTDNGMEVLKQSEPRQGGRYWRTMHDKDGRCVVRERDGGMTNVFWGPR